MVGLNRWVHRVLVHAVLHRDEYPPFRLDKGAEEPEPPPAEDPQDVDPSSVAGA